MSRAWIIDGYNVIFRLSRTANLPDGELARRRQRLEALVVRFGQQRSGSLRIVYDGQKMSHGHSHGADHPGLRISFVEPPEIADDLIYEEAARCLREKQRVCAVTSDAGLGQRLRRLGADVISAEEFGDLLDALGSPPEDDGSPPDGDGSPPGGVEGFHDIEATFLEASRRQGKVTLGRPPRKNPSAKDGGSVRQSGSESPPPAQPHDRPSEAPPPAGAEKVPEQDDEARRKRKERGRRKQARRLKLPPRGGARRRRR